MYVKSDKLEKIPPRVLSVIASLIVALLFVTLLFGPSFLVGQANDIVSNLVKPATTRLIQTVAENRQPYFIEWEESFGPHVKEVAITFWLFFFGSVLLFYNMMKILNTKDRRIITLSYVFFLVTAIFSRYSPESKLNGENSSSLFLYAVGFLAFLACSGYFYYQHYKNREMNKLRELDFSLVLIFMLFFLSIVSARGAVRLIMMLVPPASIMIAYLAVDSVDRTIKKNKEDVWKKVWAVLSVIILIATIFSGQAYYKAVSASAQGYVPSIYTQQWQKAMFWVRENTPQDAVFGHWWDYGYWLQSIGERATVLDGGNAISYWNHLMGRYALTGTDNLEAIEFLYPHKTTHFLIDSTDIGKYSAFSMIGSDVSYDRASFIPTFLRDPSQIREKKNSTEFLYRGGIGLDEDIVYEENGTKIFLPSGQAGLGGILIERDSSGKIVSPPIGLFVYQNQQYSIPFRYSYDNGEFVEFEKGIESGIYIFPSVVQQGQGLQIDPYGASLYLSKRTVKSQLARLYLYKEENPYFELVHSEDDLIVDQIKAQNPAIEGDTLFYQGFRGPIRIWEINYPENITLNEEFLNTKYPEELKIGR